MRQCSFDGCDRQHWARGWCKLHWQRWRRHGDPSVAIKGSRPRDAMVRFQSKIRVEDNGCWIWEGWLDKDGYGCFWAGKRVRPHRWIYEQTHGPIGQAHLDHFVCENRSCVNPNHVRPVTPRENVLRSHGLASVNLAKTHCIHGHPFDEKNTYVNSAGNRSCRACGLARTKRYDERKRAESKHVSA